MRRFISYSFTNHTKLVLLSVSLSSSSVTDVCSYNFSDLYNIQTDLALYPQMAYILSAVGIYGHIYGSSHLELH